VRENSSSRNVLNFLISTLVSEYHIQGGQKFWIRSNVSKKICSKKMFHINVVDFNQCIDLFDLECKYRGFFKINHFNM